jgi:hypothetical protein
MTATPTAPAPQPAPTARGRDNRWLYWGIIAVLVVLVVFGVLHYKTESTNAEAQQKAQQLTQQFQKAGLPVPADVKTITESLGTDGGAVCDNPANALGKATLYSLLTNGASFVGSRPVIVDRKILLGEGLILQTYCPEKLKPYQDLLLKLKTGDVVKQ